jgi:streptogramin lyase
MTPNIEIVFEAPGPQPNGMQATPEGLWILDQVTNQVQLVSYEGELLKTLATASDRGSGLTDDGVALWLASTYSREILKVDRATGATLATFPTPGAGQTGAHGLEFHHHKLWIAVPPSATLYQVEVGDGFTVLHTIPAPGNRPHGLAWNGDELWCVETNQRAIYQLDPENGSILAKREIPEPYPEPHGMTLWQGYFWYCDAHSRAVCRLPLGGLSQ